MKPILDKTLALSGLFFLVYMITKSSNNFNLFSLESLGISLSVFVIWYAANEINIFEE